MTARDTALPTWAVDLMRDGVAPAALRGKGDRAVWSAARRVASSAYQRGWAYGHWNAQMLAAPNRLGQQLRYHAKTGKPRSSVDLHKQLEKAWDSAVTWLDNRPDVMAAEEVARRGAERAADVLAVVEDPDAALSDRERAVLAFAAAEVLRLQREGKRVDLAPLPRRTVAAGCKITERHARAGIDSLVERGVLTLVVQGRRGKPGAVDEHGRPLARAGLYRLPDAATVGRLLSVPVNGSVGQAPKVSGTSAARPLGTPRLVSGTSANTTPEEGTRMVTLTMSAPNAQELAAALALLRNETGVQVQASESDEHADLPSNVQPIRPRRRAS